MANPKFYPCNLDGVTFTPDTSNASYPASNLSDYIQSSQWRSANITNNQKIVIDFGEIRACDYWLIGNSPLNIMTTKVEGSSSSDFTTGVVEVFNQAFIPFETPYTFSQISKRYWRITFVNTDGGVPEAGNIFIGKHFDFGTPYEAGGPVGNNKYETQEIVSLSGLVRTSQVYAGRKLWNIGFTKGNALTDAKATDFSTFFTTVRGRLRPFYFSDLDSTLHYVHCDTDINPIKKMGGNRNDITDLPLKAASVA